MNASIEAREVITLAVGDICLRGTYHRSHDDRPDLRAVLGQMTRIGVLFLNSGYLPRAAIGDSAVYWADSFAQCGYPSFRFDLPGLGDSAGDVPAQMLDFVNAGGYAPVLSALAKEIVGQFGLSGIVIFGHCAGAVTALYTAAVSKECKGLVLMDPYFFLPPERAKIRQELSNWVSWSRLGAISSSIYHRLKRIGLILWQNRLPRNANLPLLRCWSQLVSSRMPILILNAPRIRPRIGEFDYLGYLQASASRDRRLVIRFIEGTNHSFADIEGKAAVRQHSEQWLTSSFPNHNSESI